MFQTLFLKQKNIQNTKDQRTTSHKRTVPEKFLRRVFLFSFHHRLAGGEGLSAKTKDQTNVFGLFVWLFVSENENGQRCGVCACVKIYGGRERWRDCIASPWLLRCCCCLQLWRQGQTEREME